MFRCVLAIGAIAIWCAPARADDVRRPEQAAPKPAPAVTKSPKLLQAQAPEYPPAALAAGKEAKVSVRIHIDAMGTVSAVDVLVPVGDGFDEAAVAAAMQYLFEAAEIDAQLRLAISDDSGKMLSFLSGGAKVQVGNQTFDPRYLPALRREALENAMRGMFDKLLGHLRDHAQD